MLLIYDATLGLGIDSRLSTVLNPIKYSSQFPSRASEQNARHLTTGYNKNLWAYYSFYLKKERSLNVTRYWSSYSNSGVDSSSKGDDQVDSRIPEDTSMIVASLF